MLFGFIISNLDCGIQFNFRISQIISLSVVVLRKLSKNTRRRCALIGYTKRIASLEVGQCDYEFIFAQLTPRVSCQ